MAPTRRLNECEPACSGELVGVRHVSFFARCEYSLTRLGGAPLVLIVLPAELKASSGCLLAKGFACRVGSYAIDNTFVFSL
jgi:hypothetical protein